MASSDMCDRIEKPGRRKSKQAKLPPYKVANDEEKESGCYGVGAATSISL